MRRLSFLLALSVVAACSSGTSAPSDYQTEPSTASSSGGGGPCTAPSFGSKTLGDLASSEKGQLCDSVACPFGGYGKSKSCADGNDTSSNASQSDCLDDPTWSDCAALPASDFIACSQAVGADPCNRLAIVLNNSACASYKDCAGY
jgi:hypothetical protein